jgi:hypothetical protein
MNNSIIQLIVFFVVSIILLAVLSYALDKKKIKNKSRWIWIFIIIYSAIVFFLRWLIFP